MSKIEWTERTWNPIVGCSIVSPGCTNCYAMKMAARLKAIAYAELVKPVPGPAIATYLKVSEVALGHYLDTTKKVNGNIVWTGRLAQAPEKTLLAPLRRKKPTTYFVNSMGDLFHEDCPDEWIDRVFAVMALCPQHTFQVLTKRAERMLDYMCKSITPNMIGECAREIRPEVPLRLAPWPLPNVWLGVSAERQQEADERIPLLLQTPAAIRFVSLEPLLGPIKLNNVFDHSNEHAIDALAGRRYFSPGDDEGSAEPRLDWAICGGESGPNARPMHPDWARSLRDQCAAADLPFFFKQWGEWAPVTEIDAISGRARSRAIDIEGKTPPGDPMTDAGCAAIIGAVGTGGYTFLSAVGKKAAGRLLDGKLHDAFPEARP